MIKNKKHKDSDFVPNTELADKKLTPGVMNKWLDSVENFVNPDTTYWIINYIAKCREVNRTNKGANYFYVQLLKYLPKGIDKPTYNEWLYFYNMFHRQKITDKIYDQIDMLRDNLNKINDDPSLDTETKAKQVKSLTISIRQQMDQYDKFQSVILKYSNDGLNRRVREQMQDKAIKAGMSLNDMHNIMRSPKVIDVEDEKKN